MAYEKSTTVTIQKRFLKKRGKEWCDLFVHDTFVKNRFKVYAQGYSDMTYV